MTEKQKIRYISSYLSCDVDFYIAGNMRPLEKLEVHNLSQVLRNAYPLVLRPLSDLTKEIEVNGEKFVPIKKIKEMYPLDTFSSTSNIAQWSFRVVQKLLEWHFDYGLIENDLAIDINTL